MAKPDGGPAFPTSREEAIPLSPEMQAALDRIPTAARPVGTHFYAGMTLRDYFAAHALSQIAGVNCLKGAMTVEESAWVFVNAAAFAYRCADAMLAEREK